MIDMIGQKYNRLTVIKLADRDKSYKGDSSRRWLCLCECGKEVVISRRSLLSDRIKSCGCLRIESNRQKAKDRRLPGKSAAEKRLYRRYIASAKSRNLEMSLSLEDVLELRKQDCYYCGQSPNQITKTIRGSDSEHVLIHNGIDRINSSIGYRKDNCYTCCSVCNTMKMDLTIGEFFSQVEKIALRFK